MSACLKKGHFVYKGDMASFLVFGALLACQVTADFTQTVFGRSDVDGVPAAFGDFNSDELTDIFMLTDDFRTIQVPQ